MSTPKIAVTSLMGWTRSIHLRPMESSQQSIYTGRMRHGFRQYFIATGILYMFASAVFHVNDRLYLLGAAAMM